MPDRKQLDHRGRGCDDAVVDVVAATGEVDSPNTGQQWISCSGTYLGSRGTADNANRERAGHAGRTCPSTCDASTAVPRFASSTASRIDASTAPSPIANGLCAPVIQKHSRSKQGRARPL